MEAVPPVSPAKSPSSTSTAKVVALDSPLRQVPIHSDLPGIRVPAGDTKPQQYHPVTCELLSAEDFQQHKLRQLRKQFPTPEAALKAQADTIREVKERMSEREEIAKDIDRQMAEMEKLRGVERKVYMKQGKSLPVVP